MIEVGKEGIGDFAKLLTSRTRFTEVKLIGIEKTIVVDEVMDIVEDETLKHFSQGVEQEDGGDKGGIDLSFPTFKDRDDFNTLSRR